MALAFLVLSACGGGDGDEAIVPNILRNGEPEIVCCQSQIDREFAKTEIVHSTLQGLAPGRLSPRPGIETGLRLHPDAVTVVFARERSFDKPASRELFLGYIDGSAGEVRLTANAYLDDSPCWSPDGKQILYSSKIGGRRHLWRIQLDGTDPNQLSSGDVDDLDPDWTAAGVVFSRSEGSGQTAKTRLYRMNPDGSGLLPLTDGGPASGPGMGDREPALAPDGQSVLFSRRLDEGISQLMSLNLQTGLVTLVGDGRGEDRHPRWSPQGDRIFCARSRPAEGLEGLRLYALLADGIEPRLLIPDLRFAYPAFDPSPKMAAYLAPISPARDVDITTAEVFRKAGRISRGVPESVYELDSLPLGLATQVFGEREIAGVLLRIPLPVADPLRVAEVRVEVTGAITRNDQDSYFRLALHNALEQRYDSVLEVAPKSDSFQTYSFVSSSVAHLDRNANLRLEVIGDLSPGPRAELLVDHVAVKVRLYPE